jgi:GNAT superfamily N-acetyltransferase
MGNVKVRRGGRKDLDKISEIELLVFKNEAWDFDKVYDEQKSKLCFVAELNGVVVGYIFFKKKDNYCSVIRMAVLPEHRLGGIGKKLIQQARATFLQVELILSEDYFDNTCLFLKKIDFKAVPFDNGNEESFYIYRNYYENGRGAVRLLDFGAK